MNKEMYYKFIFPNYDNLQSENVKELCKQYKKKDSAIDSPTAYPVGYAMTYDQLPSRIKNYVDYYKNNDKIPKYFDIRNYVDKDVGVQSGGFSLIVSNSPEVRTDAEHGWTKFSYGGKTIYCSVIVSSGNFYYNWNLPEEVLKKSGLRDKLVSSRFHSNWYFIKKELEQYPNKGIHVGQEKYVFTKGNFQEGRCYGHKKKVLRYGHFTTNKDGTGKVYSSYSDITYRLTDGTVQAWPYFTLEKSGAFYYNNTQVYRQTFNVDDVDVETNTLKVGGKEVYPEYFIEKYDEIQEDLKRDFIDLEITRRILYKNISVPNQISVYAPNRYTDAIPKVSGLKETTSSSKGEVNSNFSLVYSPPSEYQGDRKPMPIPYDLLRNTLNNNNPYGDCETVLVMWVVDKDPAGIVDNSKAMENLQNLKWEQYAIPISVRCVVNGSYNKDRFLISYPSSTSTVTKFHVRRNSEYNKKFKEALYLPDLIRYSNDYILTYQNYDYAGSSFVNEFDIQRYLFNKNNIPFKALYARKHFRTNTNTQQNQSYYILVDNTDNKYYINKSLSRICISEFSDRSKIFVPSNHIKDQDYTRWNLIETPWINDSSTNVKLRSAIDDDWFIALFDKSSDIQTYSGELSIDKSSSLKSHLEKLTNKSSEPKVWQNLYISSLGISYQDFRNFDFSVYSVGSSDDRCYPLGLLDGYIKIGSTVYGRNKNNKVIVGLKNVFDFTNDDYYHFKYTKTSGGYDYVCSNSNTPAVTAYVMDYS